MPSMSRNGPAVDKPKNRVLKCPSDGELMADSV